MRTTVGRRWAFAWLVSLSVACGAEVECPLGFHAEGEVCLPDPAPAADVTGSVTLADGADPAGTLVSLEGTDHVSFTDDAGRFLLRQVAAGDYTLKARRLGYVEAARDVAVVAGAALALDPLQLAPAIDPQPTGALTGRVTLQGRPDGNGGVQVVLEGTGHAAFTADDGRWTLTGVAPGTYRLWAFFEGCEPAVADDVAVQAGVTAEVPDLDLAPVDGTVRGAVAGSAHLFGATDHAGIQVRLEDGSAVVAATVTDATGGFAFHEVPAGVYRVTFAHPPHEAQTVENVVAGAGLWQVPEVTLYLGRRVDGRALVAGRFADERWAVLTLQGEDGVRTVVFDARSDAAVEVPADTYLAAYDGEADTVVGSRDGELLHVDPARGEVRKVASGLYLLAPGGRGVLTDGTQRLWRASVDGALELMAEPPCPGSAPGGAAVAGTLPGWSWIGWSAPAGCPFVYQHHHRRTGHLSGFTTWWEADVERGRLLLLVADDVADPEGLHRLVRLDGDDATEATVLEAVVRLVRTTAPMVALQAPDRTGTDLVVLDPKTLEVAVRVTGVSEVQDLDGRLWMRRAGELWLLEPGAKTPVKACDGPVNTYWVAGDRAICQSGISSPWTLTAYDPATGGTTLTAAAGTVLPPTAARDWVFFRVVKGDWSAAHLPSGELAAVCGDALLVPFPSATGPQVAAWCGSAQLGRVLLIDLRGGLAEILPGTGALEGDQVRCSVSPAGTTVACGYRPLATGTPAAWSCGEATCIVAFDSVGGQRVFLGGPLAPQSTWAPDGRSALLGGLERSHHLRFGTPASVLSSAPGAGWGTPQAIGASGHFGLWRRSTAVYLTDLVGGAGVLSSGYELEALGDGGTWVTREAMVDVETGASTRWGFAATAYVGTEAASAILSANGALWRARPGQPLEPLGAYQTVTASTPGQPVWLLDVQEGAGRLAVFDPAAGDLVTVAEGALPAMSQVPGGYLVSHAVAGGRLDLCVLEPAALACRPVAAGVDAGSPLWIRSGRVACNAWREGALRLVVAHLDGSGEVDLGPAASQVAWSREGALAFRGGGLWWLEGMGPVDRGERFDPAMPLTPLGTGALYGVQSAGWPELTRNGTWAVGRP